MMHERRLSTLLLLIAMLCGLAAGAGAEELKIGLVLEQDGRNETDAKAINAATDAFLRTRRFTVVERDALDSVFQEKGLKGFIGDAEGADIGQTLGLDWIGILSYSIDRHRDSDGDVSYSYKLSVRMMEVESAQVVHTIDSAREAFTRAVSMASAGDRLLENLLAAFPAQGYVIKRVDEERVLVDLGTEQGVREGDKLEVFTHGESMIHPVTGREIPGRKITQAVLKVLRVDTGLSTCKIKKADGAVDVGDVVEFKGKDSTFGKLMDKLPFGP